MRAFLYLSVSILAAIGIGIGALGAAGDSSTGAPLSARAAAAADLQSLSAQPYLQLSLKVSDSSSRASAQDRQLLDNLQIVVQESSNDGSSALAASTKQQGAEVDLSYQGAELAEVRVLSPLRLYVKADIANWSRLPLQLSPTVRRELAGAQALLGGRWFQIPGALVKRVAPNSVQTPGTSGLAQRLRRALLSGATFSEPSQSSGDVRISGTLEPLAQVLAPLVQRFQTGLGRSLRVPNGAFNVGYLIDLTASSAHLLQRVVLSASSPSSVSAITVTMTVAHAPIQLSAPPGATRLPAGLFAGKGLAPLLQ